MRDLTAYELMVLIRHEVKLMVSDVESGVSIGYQKERAKDVLQYCEEYEALGEKE